MKLEELADVLEGITTTKANLSAASGDAYRVIQQHDLSDGRIAPRSKLKAIYVDARQAPDAFIVKRGDILVALAGTSPYVAAVTVGLEWCLAGVHVAIIRAPSNTARRRILDFLSSATGQERLRAMWCGTILLHLAIQDLRQLEVP